MNKYFEKNEDRIIFKQSGNEYLINDYQSKEIKIRPVRKNAVNTILNATANAFTRSLGNGREFVNVVLEIKFTDNRKEEIKMTEKPLIRFSLDYHELIEKTRKLERKFKKIIESNH